MADDPAGAAPQPATDGDAAPPAPSAAEPDAVLSRRVQMLATEHWGLLAARGTAQSEVLSRITIFLTLVSAGLVTIGLLGQASRFEGWFSPAMLAILAFLVVIGAMTQQRVLNVGEEDLMYVVAMNRLRGAYVDLDPQVRQYFLAAVADDEAGVGRTYSFLRPRSDASQVLGSSMMLIIVVNACVDGLLVAGLLVSLTGSIGWAVAAGVVVGLAWVLASAWRGYLQYRATWRDYRPRRTSGTAG